MDIWAYCDSCERWFYVGGAVDEALGKGHCPVCVSTPAAWRNRAACEAGEGSRLAS